MDVSVLDVTDFSFPVLMLSHFWVFFWGAGADIHRYRLFWSDPKEPSSHSQEVGRPTWERSRRGWSKKCQFIMLPVRIQRFDHKAGNSHLRNLSYLGPCASGWCILGQGSKLIHQLHFLVYRNWLGNGVTTQGQPMLLKGNVSGSFRKGLHFCLFTSCRPWTWKYAKAGGFCQLKAIRSNQLWGATSTEEVKAKKWREKDQDLGGSFRPWSKSCLTC